jgi:hypothetical protein
MLIPRLGRLTQSSSEFGIRYNKRPKKQVYLNEEGKCRFPSTMKMVKYLKAYT